MLPCGSDPPSIAPQRCLPDHLQNAYASHQSIHTTGALSLPGGGFFVGEYDVFQPHSGICPLVLGAVARNAAYSLFVTSVESMQNVPAGTAAGPPVPTHATPLSTGAS